MKVIESVKDNRTGDVSEVSWGNDMTSDLSVMIAVGHILDHQRAREAGEVHVFQGRLETISIRIEL